MSILRNTRLKPSRILAVAVIAAVSSVTAACSSGSTASESTTSAAASSAAAAVGSLLIIDPADGTTLSAGMVGDRRAALHPTVTPTPAPEESA